MTDSLPILCIMSSRGTTIVHLCSLNNTRAVEHLRGISVAVRYCEMNAKGLQLLSLSACPQLTEPVTVFRTSLWRGTSQIGCFLIIWVQRKRTKVRFAYFLIWGYANNHSHVTIVALIIVITGLFLLKGSFRMFFSFSFRPAYVSTCKLS